jgi:hypothetical protein
MTYKTVFDASQHGYDNLWSLAPFLIFVAIGTMLVLRPALMQRILPQGLQGRARMIFSRAFFAFSLLLATVVLPGTLLEYQRVAADLRDGRYSSSKALSPISCQCPTKVMRWRASRWTGTGSPIPITS